MSQALPAHSLFWIQLCHCDFVFVILCPAVGAPARQVFLASSFHKLVPAPQAHLVSALAVVDGPISGIERVHAQWAEVIVHSAGFVLLAGLNGKASPMIQQHAGRLKLIVDYRCRNVSLTRCGLAAAVTMLW